MKHFIKPALYFLTCLSSIANPIDHCKKASGQITCQQLKTERYHAQGLVNLIDSHLQHSCTIKGILSAETLSTPTLSVSGQAYLNKVSVGKQFTLHGTAKLKQSTIHGRFKAYSDHIHADTCQFDTIEIISHQQTPRLHLSHQSQVKGDIIFKGMPGQVIAASKNLIQGRIINGTHTQP